MARTKKFKKIKTRIPIAKRGVMVHANPKAYTRKSKHKGRYDYA